MCVLPVVIFCEILCDTEFTLSVSNLYSFWWITWCSLFLGSNFEKQGRVKLRQFMPSIRSLKNVKQIRDF